MSPALTGLAPVTKVKGRTLCRDVPRGTCGFPWSRSWYKRRMRRLPRIRRIVTFDENGAIGGGRSSSGIGIMEIAPIQWRELLLSEDQRGLLFIQSELAAVASQATMGTPERGPNSLHFPDRLLPQNISSRG